MIINHPENCIRAPLYLGWEGFSELLQHLTVEGAEGAS